MPDRAAGETTGMGMLGFVVIGVAIGALASLALPRGDRFWTPLIGGFAGLFGGVLSATARHGDLVTFFSSRSWLVAFAVAALAIGAQLVVARRSG